MHTSVVTVPIEEEMKRSYLDYAMSIIIGRALPDVRDGLKPVHRRILYAMYELNNTHDKPYKKSARVVGDVIGKFHPHGDQAVYDAITRMVQDFSMRYPLIDGQGNFGSIDGDAPAAMRYTEVRLSRIAEEILKDIEKDTVDWRPNYDESLKEPVVMPSRIPNLLVNGSSGIAVGMATNIPPHNLNEVVDGIIAYIDNPAITLDELLGYITGPDFPTQGIIYGRQGIREAYETGRGHITLRARSTIEKKKDGRELIVISEIPYQVNKARLIETIVDLVNTKKIEGVSNIKDESNREGIRVVIELKRGELGLPILNQLYKHTQLQTTFGIIFLTIVNNEPKVLNLRELIGEFVMFRKEVVTKRSTFELNKALDRLHILEGLKIALEHIDEVIALIKQSRNTQEARASLIDRFGLSEKQATSILEMRLQRLTNLEQTKILEDYENTSREIARLRQILEDEKLLFALVKQELLDIKAKYGDERQTEIIDLLPDITIEDMIKDEEVVVAVTHNGYIKRTALDQYRAQLRGGKGKVGMAMRDEDFVDQMFTASTHSYVVFFTNAGKAYTIKVHEIPEAAPSAKGKPVINLINAEKNERISAIAHTREFADDKYLLLVTRKGQVKKISLSALSRIRSTGLRVISLPEGDDLMGILQTSGSDEIMVATRKGKSIRFSEEDVRPMGRAAYGTRGIRLTRNDEVVSAEIVDQNCNVFTVTERGYGKVSPCSEYRTQTRGGTGIINVRCGSKNGDVVGLKKVTETSQIILMTDTGRTIRFNAKDMPVQKRGGLGVKLMDLAGDKTISAVAIAGEEGQQNKEEEQAPVEE